jgi:hypothetical protein
MKLYSNEDIKDLVQENDHLKKYSEELTSVNLKLQKELENTKDKLRHLEEVTKHTSNVVSIGSNEEELCKLEINRLYQLAKNGPLEFNQVKAFEIYVKSLMLIKGKSPVEEKKSGKKNTLSEEQLLQLALQVQVVDESNEQ